MAKYSTGGGESNAGESCELCGDSDVSLRTVNVAGAKLEVCPDCAEHDDTAKTASGAGDERGNDRQKRAAQNTAQVYDASKPDPSHWEDGADYEDDRLPYLVDDYGGRFTDARQDAGLQLGELAAELGVDESDLLAIEQGRAAQAGVGGSVVAAVEKFLDVELAEAQ
ncbi:MAG: multiprotein-bridging factor 1 family protein [Haloarculaceae archaeon]